MADVEKLIEKLEEDDDVMYITPWKKHNIFIYYKSNSSLG
jgi:transcriptional/translational regulatory protein YebC/TACO1